MIDSHCHLQYPKYDSDRDAMIRRALDADIQMICIGTDYETSKQGIEIAQKYEGVWAAVGLHPNDNLNEHYDTMMYHSLLQEPKVVAVGEIGLDYYRTTEVSQQQVQKERFENQLELAVKVGKPIVLHSRDAGKGSLGKVHADMLYILKAISSKLEANPGVAHSFTGTIEEARRYLDLGFYLGFNGIITFPPSGKTSKGQAPGMYDDLVRYVPLDRILLETDAPFLAPERYRGQRNEPLYVTEVARKLTELKSQSLDEVLDQTTKNSLTLFKIP